MKTTVYSIVLTIFLISCGGPKDPKAELAELRSERSELDVKIADLEKKVAESDTSKTDKSLEVVGTALVPQTFRTYIEVQGKVDAEENVALSSEMPGTITRIHVKVGEKVSKGQVLAETDARAVQQQVATVQTQLDLARTAFNKQKNLWEQKIGTEMQYLQSKVQVESLEASIAALQEQVRMSKIISPIDGTVDDVSIKIGQAVAPGMPAIRVVNFRNLKVKADVAESYAARVRNGNEVLVLFPDMKDSIKSTIQYSSRAIDALSRTFKVEVHLDNKKEYHPNMVARLKINDYKSDKPVIVVPVKFIQKETTGESYLLMAENKKVVKKPVKIGREYSGLAEITEGVTAGEILITEGYDLVDAGDPIRVAVAQEKK